MSDIQEQIKLAHKRAEENDIKLLKEENEMLKLEIERLNDVLIHKPDEKITLKTKDGQELFIIQSERIDMQEELNKANMELMIKLEDYKSRNEKAIEYINKFESIKAYYEYTDEDGYDEYNYDDDFKKDILNILKGDNK